MNEKEFILRDGGSKRYLHSSSMHGRDNVGVTQQVRADSFDDSNDEHGNCYVEGFGVNSKPIEDLSIIRGDADLGNSQFMPNLSEFLKMTVAFAGQNIEKSIRKVITLARAILEKPKLLMLYEEAINCGHGVAHNINILKNKCPDSTVMSITRSNRDILSYDQIILMDGGMVIDQGDPKELILQEQSHFYNYLKETDHDIFLHLKQKLAYKSKHLLRTGDTDMV